MALFPETSVDVLKLEAQDPLLTWRPRQTLPAPNPFTVNPDSGMFSGPKVTPFSQGNAVVKSSTRVGNLAIDPEQGAQRNLFQAMRESIRKSRACSNGHRFDAAYTDCPECGVSDFTGRDAQFVPSVEVAKKLLGVY